MTSTLAPADPEQLISDPAPEPAPTPSYTMSDTPTAVGGQGSVYRSVGPDGTVVAIKVAHAGRLAGEALACEATLLRELGERGLRVVPLLREQLEVDGRPALVLEWVEHAVDDWVAQRRAAAPDRAIEEVLEVAVALCRALGSLHACTLPDPRTAGSVGRVIHRDLKPGNVRVDGDGRIVLIDLGGSLVVDRSEAVRLAVFGSPLWAPYDQVLPGEPEPSPAWDTYAALVMLFGWVTGTRPEYQADPSPMLTEQGRQLWAALAGLATADRADRDGLLAAHRALTGLREGTREVDLVDVRGHSAIQEADRQQLAAGVRALARVDAYGEVALDSAAQELARVMARGLSPISHPSPPNRFWDANELAAELDGVRARLVDARQGLGLQAHSRTLGQRVAQLETRNRQRRIAVSLLVGLAIPVGLSAVFGGVLLGSRARAPVAPIAPVAPADPVVAVAAPDHRDVVAVAAGPFAPGDVDADGSGERRAAQLVDLAAFELDRTEVPVSAWRACMADGACSAAAWMSGAGVPAEYQGLTADDQPVVGVTWNQARSYCKWKGGRLPTEWEWEKAATWSPLAEDAEDKRAWPWGALPPDCARAVWVDCGASGALPIDALPAGASAYGAMHLTGNVWEWTDSVWPGRRGLFRRGTDDGRVLRGGSWQTPRASIRPTFRRHVAPSAASPIHGFRCAYDP